MKLRNCRKATRKMWESKGIGKLGKEMEWNGWREAVSDASAKSSGSEGTGQETRGRGGAGQRHKGRGKLMYKKEKEDDEGKGSS